MLSPAWSIGAGIVERSRRSWRCSVASGCPSRRTVSVAGSPLSSLSSTRALIVWSLPTMPKRGASTSSMPPVALALVAGDEHMQRRVKAERGGGGGNVVDDAVGDEDRAADALGRRVAERRAQRGEQLACPCCRDRRAASRRNAPRHCRAPRVAFRVPRAPRRSARSRSPMRLLAERSMTTATTSFSGRRSSRCSEGSSSAEQQQRRGERAPERRARAGARASGRRRRAPSAASASSSGSGQDGRKGERPVVQCESLSSRSFAWT